MNAAAARSGLRRGLEVLVLVLMGALALIVVVGVGFRKAGASLVWYDEVASILLAERELLDLQLSLFKAQADHGVALARLEAVAGRPVRVEQVR